MLLEAKEHGDNAFLTLTYDDEHLPLTRDGIMTLHPPHVPEFLKRLRDQIHPVKIRYFGIGEYGTHTQRPHYHLGLFGYPACLQGETTPDKHGYCCPPCDQIKKSWGHAKVIHVKPFSDHNAEYMAEYFIAKITRPTDEAFKGRTPEKTFMSRKPAIGSMACHDIASVVMDYELEDTIPDVPKAIRKGAKLHPIGRTLVQKVRERIGRDRKTPEAELRRLIEETRPFKEAAFAASTPGTKYMTLENMASEAGLGRRIQIERKYTRKKGVF